MEQDLLKKKSKVEVRKYRYLCQCEATYATEQSVLMCPKCKRIIHPIDTERKKCTLSDNERRAIAFAFKAKVLNRRAAMHGLEIKVTVTEVFVRGPVAKRNKFLALVGLISIEEAMQVHGYSEFLDLFDAEELPSHFRNTNDYATMAAYIRATYPEEMALEILNKPFISSPKER